MKEMYLQWLFLCKCHVGVLRGLHQAPGAHHEAWLTRHRKVTLKLLFKGADITWTQAHTHTHTNSQSHIQIYTEEQLFQYLREQSEEVISTKVVLWISLWETVLRIICFLLLIDSTTLLHNSLASSTVVRLWRCQEIQRGNHLKSLFLSISWSNIESCRISAFIH